MFRNIIILVMALILCPLSTAGIQHKQKALNALEYFSSDYTEARKKFLDAAGDIDAKIESFKNPNTGPIGEPLYTDVALIGSEDAKDILVLISGTHGVEGFAGSGIQTGLLHEDIAANLKPDMSIVMIHANNPYGFAHLRRFNEDSIDLNRNFLDHSQPHPVNHGYKDLLDAINPKSISLWVDIKSRFDLLWYRLKEGKTSLREVISRGQYEYPQGLFYGGQFETWSNKTIREIANRYLSTAERVVVIDFHTGLGLFGHGEIILNELEESPSYKRAVEWWGERVRTTVSNESVSVHIKGPLKLAIPDMLPNAEVTAVSLEFGTYPPKKVFWDLRAENWLHHYGGKEHPKAKQIKADLLHAFYPEEDEWKSQVWEQGKEVVRQVLVEISR